MGINQTTVCSSVNGSEWKMIGRRNGKETQTSFWNISLDGKTFTTRTNRLHPDGTQTFSEKIFTRKAGTVGFPGRWQEPTPLDSLDTVLQIELNGTRLHLAYPDIGEYSDSPIDGSVVPVQGLRVAPKLAISTREISPLEFDTKTILSGRVIREGTIRISESDRTLVQESWGVQHPDEKDRLVYDKQSPRTHT